MLPLQNMSPDPNDEYFADGMTEELITALSGIGGLTVIARTSVMPYKTTAKRVAEIGRELGVGTLIEGSVRKAANRVRISVQIIDASNEGHLWASNYDRELNDIFAVQSEIAEKVVETIKGKLLDSDRQKLAKSSTDNVEAHTLYLKGRYYWNLRSRDGLQKAVQYFKLAVEADPDFAAAYSGLAECFIVMGRNGLSDPVIAYPKAKEYVMKALELNPYLPEAHADLASILHYYDHRLEASESEFRKAIELNPNYASAHQWFAHLLGQEGRRNEAFAEIRRAAELDPLSRAINLNVGDALYYQGEFDAAIAQFKKVIDLDPKYDDAYASLLEAYVRKSMYDDALAAAETYGRLSNKPLETTLMKAYVHASQGDKEKARNLLSEVEEHFREEVLSPYRVGIVHFLIGDSDAGFDWLDRAYDGHDPNIMLMNIDFELATMKTDPRFLLLLEKVGLSEKRK